MSIFDSIGKQTFDVIKAFDGRSATWTPLDNSPEVTKTVLYNHPTKKVNAGENDFLLEDCKMEYYENDFPGLFESVQDANNEKIKVEVSKDVFQDFIIKRCEKKYDGKTIIAILTPIQA